MSKKLHPITDELLDQLLANYQKPEDLIGAEGILKQLTKKLVERALDAELTHHLGHDKHQPVGNSSGNTRNGFSRKKLKGEFGELPIEIPRDRHGTFEPQIVEKHQTRWVGFDDKILSLYARGMTVREIQAHLQEMYGAEVSPSLISSVTDAVTDEVKAWQSRPLDAVYPIVYLDCIHTKVREGAVRVKAVYLALGINLAGEKGNPRAMDRPERGCQVLVAGGDRVAQPWRAGHLHRLRGWPEGLPRGHRGGLPAHQRATVHRAYGQAQPELRLLETARRGSG